MTQQKGDDRLRVAIVGCGALAELFYVPAFRCLGGTCRATVAALIDSDPARAASVGRHFPDARIGTRLDDIPDDTQVAIVASPAGFHAEQTVALLRPSLCDARGRWTADYTRLRFAARAAS